MPLSWNEIKTRAIAFSKDWQNGANEDADAKEFLIDFLNVFGISRKRVATFEHKVQKLNTADGYIDLLWKGMLLVEMKSLNKDLDKAYQQAKDYCHGLKDHDLPKLILVSDFQRLRLYDEDAQAHEFLLSDLVNNVQLFAPIAGYQKRTYKEQDPVNIDAAERMGKLHDKLKAIGYEGHALEVYLVRLLFCLFADDTGIFERGIFHEYVEQKTNVDGSDLAPHIQQLFQILNTPEDKRLKLLDEHLSVFPYVNGKLFEEVLPVAAFDSEMRKILLNCCELDWGKISPAIFGSLFQSVMDEKARRNLGAHYTSEKNILKLIKPLFLDELWKDLNDAGSDKHKLKKLHDRISKLLFLDPACGCGNFLIIAYRELRLLELELVRRILRNQTVTDISQYFLVDVDQFYGIEYEEFPAQIAQVAMWLIDHQMNMEASVSFGEYFVRLPLKKSANIINDNALRVDWNSLLIDSGKPVFDFILGNPPFVGTAYQDENQKADMSLLFLEVRSSGMLDYVSAWYIKAAQYLRENNSIEDKSAITKVGFVSTNSITQGEQVGILWSLMFNQFKIKIHFAHRTFKWNNEAKGNAAVHVVIIGFSNYNIEKKTIYVYDDVRGEPHELSVKNINPYLVEGSDIVLPSISNPIISSVPKMQSGSAARDGGFLILSNEEKDELISRNPRIENFLKRFISGDDFINDVKRWCIWLKGVSPNDFRGVSEFQERFNQVRAFRLKSTRGGTMKMADLPYLFAEERQPDYDFLIIPKVSSENRKYIPIGYLSKDYIVSDKTFVVPNTTLFHFGVLTSMMHNVWMRYTCGRLESRYSYSNTIVYNNFPWPDEVTDKKMQAVREYAQSVLDIRGEFVNSSLADLYDPLAMPEKLLKAHQALDRAVDICYRSQPFANETKRIEYLFELYEKYTAGLFVKEKKKKYGGK